MIADALFLLSKLFWLLLRPNTLALTLAAIGMLGLWRRRRWARWPALVGMGWFLLIAATPLATWLTWPLENRFSRPAAPPARVDGVVVLGGAVDQAITHARGLPSLNGAAERMTEAVALAWRYPAARVVFTGGSPSPLGDAMTEAAVAERLFGDLGLPPGRLLLESEARNTHENATLSRVIAAPRPGETWLLITSASHMPRAMGVFRGAGWNDIIAWPVNYSTGVSHLSGYDMPFPARLGQAEWALREYIGMLAYWLMGRSPALFPAP